jgi:outer membrane protein TolC
MLGNLRRHTWKLALLPAIALSIGPSMSAVAAEDIVPTIPVWSPQTPRAPLPACADPLAVLQGPIVSDSQALQLSEAKLEETDKPLPINLATALRLAGGRPLEIAAAEASLRTAQAQLDGAKVLWLPNVYVGGSYYGHEGAGQGNSGIQFVNTRNQYMAGGGLTAVFSAADAIFAPLALRQVVRSRESDIQAARNDSLASVAEAYFNVQKARGQLAGSQDAVTKARELVRTVTALGKDLTAPFEVERVRAQMAETEQTEAMAREQWRFASADLTRVLRLDPGAVVVPLESPYLQVTLISSQEPVDKLIPIGLTNRPELASQQALVQATLARLKEERLRPLVPSLVLGGDAAPAAPGGYLMAGAFGSNLNGSSNSWGDRSDVSVQLVWELRNLGFGNRALTRERRAERDQAIIDLYRVQDRVAAEVVQARAQAASATVRVAKAEAGLKAAKLSFEGNLKGLSETYRAGDRLVLINRPQEAVAALQQLSAAYDNYAGSVNDYNRAQFRLYRALGFPAEILAWERSTGEIQPVDTTRPPQMAPVCPVNPSRLPH